MDLKKQLKKLGGMRTSRFNVNSISRERIGEEIKNRMYRRNISKKRNRSPQIKKLPTLERTKKSHNLVALGAQ